MSTSTAKTTTRQVRLVQEATQYRREAEDAKGRQEYEFAFLLLDKAEQLEREAEST